MEELATPMTVSACHVLLSLMGPFSPCPMVLRTTQAATVKL